MGKRILRSGKGIAEGNSIQRGDIEAAVHRGLGVVFPGLFPLHVNITSTIQVIRQHLAFMPCQDVV